MTSISFPSFLGVAYSDIEWSDLIETTSSQGTSLHPAGIHARDESFASLDSIGLVTLTAKRIIDDQHTSISSIYAQEDVSAFTYGDSWREVEKGGRCFVSTSSYRHPAQDPLTNLTGTIAPYLLRWDTPLRPLAQDRTMNGLTVEIPGDDQDDIEEIAVNTGQASRAPIRERSTISGTSDDITAVISPEPAAPTGATSSRILRNSPANIKARCETSPISSSGNQERPPATLPMKPMPIMKAKAHLARTDEPIQAHKSYEYSSSCSSVAESPMGEDSGSEFEPNGTICAKRQARPLAIKASASASGVRSSSNPKRRGPDRQIQNKVAQKKYRDKKKAISQYNQSKFIELVRTLRRTSLGRVKSVLDRAVKQYVGGMRDIDTSIAAQVEDELKPSGGCGTADQNYGARGKVK